MIKGFEDITYELTEKEKRIARKVYVLIINVFRDGGTISNPEIQERIGEKSLSAPRVRKIIHWLHTNGHLPYLIGTSKGYAYAETKEELLTYREGLIGRLNSLQARIDAVDRTIGTYQTPQLKLEM